jgi:hypothetical protein
LKEGNEVKDLQEVKESKDNPFPVHMRIGAFSGPLFPLPPQLPSLPLLLRKFLTIRLAASLAALATFTPILFAQAAQPQGTTNAPSAASSTPNALSHDLGGVWMQYPDERVGGVPIVTGIDEKTRPPLTPWGQARFDAAIPFMGPRAVAGKENNPSLRCVPESVPKSLILPNPFEIVQIPGRVFMFFEEFHLWRTIWTDGRALPKDPDPSYLGYSVGKWEGETFVVDTIGFNDKPWVDSFGNPRSEQMHLTERYRRLNRDTLEMQIIMDDPKAYTKTWVSAPRLFKFEPGWELGEFFCVLDEENAYSERVRKPAGGAETAPK